MFYKIDKFLNLICAEHLVLTFLEFFLSHEPQLPVIHGDPNELPHPKIVNLFFNLNFQKG